MKLFRWAILFLSAGAGLLAAPTLEIYDAAPAAKGRPLLLILKLSNPDDRDYYVWAESITAIPFHARFRDRGGECDLLSEGANAVLHRQRLRAGSYALIDTQVIGEVLRNADGQVEFRCDLYADSECREPVVMRELVVSFGRLFPVQDSAESPSPPPSAEPPRR